MIAKMTATLFVAASIALASAQLSTPVAHAEMQLSHCHSCHRHH